jgi:hypothetical protein
MSTGLTDSSLSLADLTDSNLILGFSFFGPDDLPWFLSSSIRVHQGFAIVQEK